MGCGLESSQMDGQAMVRFEASRAASLTGRPPLMSRVHLVFLLRQWIQARYALIGSGALTGAAGCAAAAALAASVVDATAGPEAIVSLD
jgi:hypothetical protein